MVLRKLYTIIIIAIVLSVRGNAQSLSLTDRIDIHIPSGDMQKAVQFISDQTGLRFAFRKKIVQDIKIDSIRVNTTIGDLFDKIFTTNRICYTWQNNQVILHTNCYPRHYTITGTILETESMVPVSFAAVSKLNSDFGTIADEEGYFEIDLPYSEIDSLIVSSMGYHRDTITVGPGTDNGLIILLKAKIYAIPETIIRPVQYKTFRLGNNKDRSTGSLYIDTHGQQTALFVENEKEKLGEITAVQFYISEDGNTNSPLRIHIYETDSAGKPSDDLIEDAVVVLPDIGEGWYSVDVSMLSIKMPPNGIYIALEGVFPGEYSNYFGSEGFIDLANPDAFTTNTLTYGQRIGYNRKCRENTWHYSISKVWFQLEKQSFGVMISAIVNYEDDDENENSVNYE